VPERIEVRRVVVLALGPRGDAELDARRILEATALGGRGLDRLARATREVERARRRQLAARQRRAVADDHLVVAGRDRDAHRGALGLVGLGDDRVRALVLDERLALERRGQLDRARRRAWERQRHLAVALEIGL